MRDDCVLIWNFDVRDAQLQPPVVASAAVAVATGAIAVVRGLIHVVKFQIETTGYG